MKLKYNILLEENDDLQSKLNIANQNSKILVKKHREQHDTAEVCSYNTI